MTVGRKREGSTCSSAPSGIFLLPHCFFTDAQHSAHVSMKWFLFKCNQLKLENDFSFFLAGIIMKVVYNDKKQRKFGTQASNLICFHTLIHINQYNVSKRSYILKESHTSLQNKIQMIFSLPPSNGSQTLLMHPCNRTFVSRLTSL